MTDPNPTSEPVVNPSPNPEPNPEPNPTPNPVPNPVSDPTNEPNSSDRLDRLENIVDGLLNAVSKLIPNDDKPTRKPWTHYGSRDR